MKITFAIKGVIVMQKCHIAVDIGASSGRVMAGWIEKKDFSKPKLQLKEMHRFENKVQDRNGHLIWDIEHLYHSIIEGVKQTVKKKYVPQTLGIDTWAVDFVLLDENENRLTDAISYRDSRTEGVMEEVFKTISKETFYKRTGIQFQPFNTIYQLVALKKQSPEILSQAKTFLMIPDYLNYLLTGSALNEYTNATSTQLLNLDTKNWDKELLDQLNIPADIFQEIALPNTTVGKLKDELVQEIGCAFDIVLPATHDTASAVVSVPENGETIYLSSGTWSLLGIETKDPITTSKAMTHNFTNEGGINFRYRFLKNIMGLWMIQEVKRLFNDTYNFSDFVELAQQSTFNGIIDVNDQRFLSPNNMIEAMKEYCRETSQKVPETPGEIARCIFLSLAKSYKQSIEEIEDITGRVFDQISIIGGGTQNELLNQMLAEESGKTIYTGPVEATAIGNIIVQLMQSGQIKDLVEARKLVHDSFEIKSYKPEERK